MSTQQPVWKFVANLGDVNPIEHGGLFVYVDETGVYAPEAELLQVDGEDDDNTTWEVRRFVLENLKLMNGPNGEVYLVAARYEPDWPNPLEDYDEWFHKDLERVASTSGQTVETLRECFTSSSPTQRALAWQAVGEHHGWDNLDSDPLTFTSKAEVRERYAKKNT